MTSPEQFATGDWIGPYRIVSLIGSGAFGRVYKVEDEYHACKAMKVTHDNQKMNLFNEYTMCKAWWENPPAAQMISIPRAYCYANLDEPTPDSSFFTCDLLQSTLAQGKRAFERNEKTILRLARMGFLSLKHLHERIQRVHGDIKPEHIMIDKLKSLYWIDFGLSKTVPTSDFVHSDQFCGTLRYGSIALHQGHTATCRDDAESFVYTLLYLYYGSLPWEDSIPSTTTVLEQSRAVMQLKQNWLNEQLRNFSSPSVVQILVEILRALQQCQFAELPAYDTFLVQCLTV